MWRLALFLLWPMSVLADPVFIRSGEHETFSRLVLTIDPGTPWTLESSSDGFVLSLEGENDGFDIGEVFDRIPKERLRDLRQVSGGGLMLVVTCTCHADGFLWRADRLVIDVVDGLGPIDALRPLVNETPLAARPPQTRDSAAVLPDLLGLPNGLSLAVGGPAPAAPEFSARTHSAQRAQPSTSDLAAMEDAILEGLARAATQGYLDPRVLPAPVDPPSSTFVAAARPIEVAPIDPAASAQLGIGVSTALDETLQVIGERLNALETSQCLDASTFDVVSWADDRGLHEQVAAMAEDLSGSFGAEPVLAHTRLAQLYLHFGFGAEALAILKSEPTASQKRGILIELATLIDGYEGPFPQLQSQYGCATSGALWAFLAGSRAPDTEDGRHHLLRSFFTIPQPLRGHLAPRLSAAFLDEGFTEEAERALRSTDVPDLSDLHDVQTSRAELADAQGQAADALRILRQEVADNPHVSPNAVVDLINLTIAQGHVPSEAELLVASGLSDEYREHPAFSELRLAQARGTAARGLYDEALALLNDLDGNLMKGEIDQIYTAIGQSASPAVFLDFAFGPLPEHLPDATINEFGKRLIDLGFPDQALAVLARPAVRDAAAERRYLQAAAALDGQKFSQVIEVLSGINSERAKAFRAEAFAGLGDYRTALSEGGRNQPERNDLQQFRAQAWERLTLAEDDVLADFARARLDGTGADSATTLIDRQTLVQRSQDSRRAIENLLLQFSEADLTQ